MPEWLELFRPAAKSGVSAIRSLAPAITRNVISFQPTVGSVLGNTYFLPAASLSGISRRMYNTPMSSVLEYPSTEMTTLISDPIRNSFRASLGIPEGFDSSSSLSLDQARNVLRGWRNAPQNADARINIGLSARDPRNLNYRQILNRAGDKLYFSREYTPYNSTQEFLEEYPLFNIGGYAGPSREVGVDATVRGFAEGADMSDPVFDQYINRAARMAYNRGFIGADNPYLQRALALDTAWGLHLDDAFDTIGSTVSGSDSFYTGGEDRSRVALDKLGHFGARYLTAQEKAKLLESALPDGITMSDITPEQMREFKRMIHPKYSSIGGAVSRRYDRGFLNTMANLDALPESERAPILEAINSAYGEPVVNNSKYGDELFKMYSGIFSNKYGIDITPEELKTLFNVHDPNYPEVSAKVRAKGLELLPGDITHMNWFQVETAQDNARRWVPNLSTPAFSNWTQEQKNQFTERAKKILEPILNSQAQIRTGIQARALERAVPRGTGIFETNTSPDSYKLNIRTAITSPLYGVGPGKITLFPLKENGNLTRMYGNNLQLNRLSFDNQGKIKSSIGLPEVEKNAFTENELLDILTVLGNDKNDPNALKLQLDSNPAYKEMLTRILNVVKAVKNQDANSIIKTFELANKKNKALGLQEFNPYPATMPLYPDNPGFYDSKNLDDIYWLLSDIQSSSSYDGWAPQMRRIPIGSLKQKRGGRIPR